MVMTLRSLFAALLLILCSDPLLQAQSEKTTDPQIVDIVWLRNGSRLTGTIVRWELERGMELKLLTGATMVIPKREIDKVFQDRAMGEGEVMPEMTWRMGPKPYAFKEEGWYHTFSGFLNTSFIGGAGLHYSFGHRFNRLLCAGLGIGIETNDFDADRDIVPIFAEARGFLLQRKITPYYALKIGYGIALKSDEEFFGSIVARGGFHLSPEIGVRFGSGPVCYYFGGEYKLQNASYRTDWGEGGFFVDKISYRRFEFRTGVVF